jgi:biopolymer transport protein ExbB
VSGSTAINVAVFAALGLLSVMATAVTIYKLIQFARMGLGRRSRLTEVMHACDRGQTSQALHGLAGTSGVLPRVLHATLAGVETNPSDLAFGEEAGRQAALAELTQLTRSMRVLESVVQAAPMLGLLGTVIGMINAFSRLASATGAVDPAVLAGGIYFALTTTAAGLTIAIIFYFVATWFERERLDMEMAISVVIHGRSGPGSGSG